ncbi:hypothetical protein QET93_010015 [Akkermansia sp. N21116]|jgi:hypothetical protein|uniref:NADase-type glycan-binding domain-containing protein n=1 Tax=Akkermansia sp. N21116 TaxID=3040764 RepID=UPI002AC9C18B|nr:hypothetical protein [Akkermansia sp. N21116]WPX39872.1 hypothetical protein QET93_010015 [Akkermansia sp. N21116]
MSLKKNASSSSWESMKLPFSLHCMLTAGLLLSGSFPVCGEAPIPTDKPSQTQEAPQQNQAKAEYTATFPAPIPGIPMPMNLSAMDGVSLDSVHIDLAVRQHEVLVIYTCTLTCDAQQAGKKLPMGIPFQYKLPDAEANASSPLPIHRVPFSKSLGDISVGVNQLAEEWKQVEGRHPQYQAPSLQQVSDITHWLTFSPKLKQGPNTLTIHFTVPYRQTRQYLPHQDGAQIIQNPLLFQMDLNAIRTWSAPIQHGEILIFSEEMLPDSLNLISPQDKNAVTRSEKGVMKWDFTPQAGQPPTDTLALEFGPRLSFRENANEKRTSLKLNNTPIRIPGDYKIETSSSAGADPFGNACSPDNLREGSQGFWAEGAEGDGESQFILITFPTPQKLEGLLIQPGISPVRLGRNGDTEARRHPAIAYSLYNRPHSIRVILNDGQYEFKATLRDDWNEQLVIPPYFKGSVKSVKIILEKITQGANSEDTFLTGAIPLVK